MSAEVLPIDKKVLPRKRQTDERDALAAAALADMRERSDMLHGVLCELTRDELFEYLYRWRQLRTPDQMKEFVSSFMGCLVILDRRSGPR